MMPWRVKIRVFSVQRVLKAFTTHLTARRSATSKLILLWETLIGDW